MRYKISIPTIYGLYGNMDLDMGLWKENKEMHLRYDGMDAIG